MNCEELEPWVSAYQDGELDSRRRRIVEAHLALCGDCRSLADGWAALAQDIRTSLGRLDAPESLHTRVMRRIPAPAAQPHTRSHFRWPLGRPSFALVPIGAAAAWLFWAAHPALKAPLPPRNPATAPATAARALRPGPVPAG